MTNRRCGMRWVSRLAWAWLWARSWCPASGSAVDDLQYSHHRHGGPEEGVLRIRLSAAAAEAGRRAVPDLHAARRLRCDVRRWKSGVNIAITHYVDDGGNFTYFQPNAKYKFYADDDKGLAASAGIIGYIADEQRTTSTTSARSTETSARRSRAGPDSRAAYGAPSRTATTIRVACFSATNSRSAAARSASWPTGSAARTSGATSRRASRSRCRTTALLNIGYSLGNDSSRRSQDIRNRALFVYYGITFP